MKSFLTFLLEIRWKKETNPDFNVTSYSHSKNIHGHDVNVNFTQLHNDPSGRNYDASFSVNKIFSQSLHKAPPTAEQGRNILQHVAKTIHGFVKDKKPAKMLFQPNERRKESLYQKFANHVAKRHGGSVESWNHPVNGDAAYVVHFNKKGQ